MSKLEQLLSNVTKEKLSEAVSLDSMQAIGDRALGFLGAELKNTIGYAQKCVGLLSSAERSWEETSTENGIRKKAQLLGAARDKIVEAQKNLNSAVYDLQNASKK